MNSKLKAIVLASSIMASSLVWSPSVLASDVPATTTTTIATKAPAKQVNPFSQPYDIGKCGGYFGVNAIGSASSLQGTGVTPGTQVVQGGIGGTLGYGCPINASNGSFWAIEVMADATNINGASSGLSFTNAPVTFTERFIVGSPLQNMLASLPGWSSVTGSAAVPSLPALLTGVTAGPGAPYGFLAMHQADISAQLGLNQNQEWLLSWGIGAGILYRLSNQVVADVFAEYKISTNEICVGPYGQAGCGKFSNGFMTGVVFKY